MQLSPHIHCTLVAYLLVVTVHRAVLPHELDSAVDRSRRVIFYLTTKAHGFGRWAHSTKPARIIARISSLSQ